jgi:glycerol-3-phosphate cytidylyltransferase
MITGFTCGAFDLLHPGHLALFKQATEQCDRLIVGLHTNPKSDRPYKNAPIQTVYERYTQLIACQDVDCVIPYDTEKDLENLLATETIDIRFLGEEYVGQKITAQQICEERNIKIVFLNRKHSYSSTELRERIKNAQQ